MREPGGEAADGAGVGIDDLPDLVLDRVLQLLPVRDIATCLGVCARWRAILRAPGAARAGGGAGPDGAGPAGPDGADSLRDRLASGLHLRWRREEILCRTLHYRSTSVEPGANFYVPLPLRLSFLHHHRDRADRTPAPGVGERRRECEAGFIGDSDAGYSAAVQRSLRWRREDFIGDARMSDGYLILRTRHSSAPCVIDCTASTLREGERGGNTFNVVPRDGFSALAGHFPFAHWGAMAISAPMVVTMLKRERTEGWEMVAWLVLPRAPGEDQAAPGVSVSAPTFLGRELHRPAGAPPDDAGAVCCLECEELSPWRAHDGRERAPPCPRRRWRIASASSAGHLASNDVCCLRDGAPGDHVRHTGAARATLDAAREGAPTAIAILGASGRIAVGTSVGLVVVFRAAEPRAGAAGGALLRETSFSTVATPVVQMRLCGTGGAMGRSLVVLNSANAVPGGGGGDAPGGCPSDGGGGDGCPVCEATHALRRRGADGRWRDDSGFDGLEALWPRLATKRLGAMAAREHRGGACPLIDLTHANGHGRHHCLASLSMWYEGGGGGGPGAWSPAWCRFVPDSATLAVSHESAEGAILVSGIAGVLLLDGHGRVVRKLPNRDADMHTVAAAAAAAAGSSPWDGRTHLKGSATSVSAWFVGAGAGAPGFQVVTLTQIDYLGPAGDVFQRTLSMQIQAPDAMGSIRDVRCACGARPARTVVHVNNVNGVSRQSLLDQSSRYCLCCSHQLPKQPDGRRRRRCDFLLVT